MVLCKFFLQGNCRFGENCKFEHQINDGRHHSSVLRQQNFPVVANPGGTTNSNIDTNTLIRAVVNDMVAAERGGQWLLSCYAPFKEKPNFPGFDEKSMEEVRLAFYEAQHMGTINQVKEQFQMCLQAATVKIRALQNPSPEAINTIKAIYNSTPGSMVNNMYGSNAAASTFSNNPPPNVFAPNQNSIFANNANSIFSQPNNYTSTNIFAQNSQQTNPAAKSMFSTNSQKLFVGVQQQQSSSIFSNNQPNPPTQSIFAQPNPGSFVGGALPITNAFAPAYPNQNQPFMQQPAQQVSSPFAMQQSFPQGQSGIGEFSMQQGVSSSSSPFGTQQQIAAALPFATQTQQSASPFGIQPQGNSPLMAVAQPNAFAPQQNPQFVAASPFSMQQQAQPFLQPVAPFANTTGIFSNNLPVQQPALSSLAHSTNIFGSSAGNAPNAGGVEIVEGAYSKLEELSEADLKSYAGDSFEFGKIPVKPPTIEMCL